jgi:hypothetical protein
MYLLSVDAATAHSAWSWLARIWYSESTLWYSHVSGLRFVLFRSILSLTSLVGSSYTVIRYHYLTKFDILLPKFRTTALFSMVLGFLSEWYGWSSLIYPLGPTSHLYVANLVGIPVDLSQFGASVQAQQYEHAKHLHID